MEGLAHISRTLTAAADGPSFPQEPAVRWGREDFDALLVWAATAARASDLSLVPERPAWIKVDGRNSAATRRPVPAADISLFLDHIFRSSAGSAMVRSGDPVDCDYPVRLDRLTTLRFRANALTVRDREDAGISIVLRPIPAEPPRLATLEVPAPLLAEAFPERGLVVVTGRTGSGKTTLIAALMRHIIEGQRRSVQTLESPIEFDLMGIPASGPVSQTAVPAMVKSFALGIRATTRRSTDVLLVGEARDAETFAAMLWAAETGTCVYATLHTPSAAEVFPRVINAFPHIQQPAIAASLLETVRLVIHQRLVPRVGGGRVALREWCPVTPALREALQQMEPAAYARSVGERLRLRGTDLVSDAERAFAEGLIDPGQLAAIRAERRNAFEEGGEPLID